MMFSRENLREGIRHAFVCSVSSRLFLERDCPLRFFTNVRGFLCIKNAVVLQRLKLHNEKENINK